MNDKQICFNETGTEPFAEYINSVQRVLWLTVALKTCFRLGKCNEDGELIKTAHNALGKELTRLRYLEEFLHDETAPGMRS